MYISGARKSSISIHAPREGSDFGKCFFGFFFCNFNPRSPRGERPVIALGAVPHIVFQSTLPARGATRKPPTAASRAVYFNPRSPRGERRAHPQPGLLAPLISIHAPREGSDSNIAQIFTIRTAILQHGYQTRLVFGTKSIVLNRKKSFKLPVFLREPTGLFMFTSGSRHGRSKNQRVGHIYGGACTDVLNLSLI